MEFPGVQRSTIVPWNRAGYRSLFVVGCLLLSAVCIPTASAGPGFPGRERGAVEVSLGTLIERDEVVLDVRLLTHREGVIGVSAHFKPSTSALVVESVEAGRFIDDGDVLPFRSNDGDGTVRVAFTRKGSAAAASGSGALVRVRLRATAYLATPGSVVFSQVHLIDAQGRLVELVDAELAVDVERILVPLPATGDEATTLEDASVLIPVLANDAPGLPLDAGSVEVVTTPEYGLVSLDTSTGWVGYAPNPDFCGMDGFSYSVAGADGHRSDETPVRIEVGCVNDAPTILLQGDVGIDEDSGPVVVSGFVTRMAPGPANESSQKLTLSLDADDPSFFETPATLSPTGDLAFAVKAGLHGTVELTASVQDDGSTDHGGVDRATARFRLTVRPVNDAPTAGSDEFEVLQNAVLRVGAGVLQRNDTDPEGAPLSVRLESDVTNGSLRLSSDGSFLYVPASGYVGIDGFRYRASDGVLESEPAQVVLTVTPDEDRDGVPAAAEEAAPNGGDGNGDGLPDALQENVTSLPIATGAKTGEYLTLVSPVGTRLTQVESLLENPSPEDYPAGATPPVGFLSFQVHDLPPAATQVVTILVPRGVTAVDYLKYGPTPDNPVPHWYSFAFDGTTGAIIVGETPERQGYIELHFTDGARGDDDLVANGILVDPGVPVLTSNRVPSVVADAVSLDEDSEVQFLPLANDRDDDGDALAVLSVTTPAHGTATLEAGGAVRYVPGPDYHGVDEFSILVSDGRSTPVRSPVIVEVRPVNDAPRFVSVPTDLTVREGETVRLAWTASDVDGDAISYSGGPLPEGATLDPVTGILTWTAARTGARFVITASDGPASVVAPPVLVNVREVDRYAVVLAGVHLRPAVSTTAAATGEVRLVEGEGVVEFDFTISNLTAPLVAATLVHARPGDAAEPVTTVEPLRTAPDRRSAEFRGQVPLSRLGGNATEWVRRLRSGEVALVVSTSAYPQGEAAGRLLGLSNRPPARPSLTAPAVVDLSRPDVVAILSHGEASDPDGDPVLHILQVATDAGFTRVVKEQGSFAPADFPLTADWVLSVLRGPRAEEEAPVGGARFLYARVIASDGALWAVSDAAAIEIRLASSVDTRSDGLPDRVTLEPNFPNPFNPATTIRFAIPAVQRVTLTVYDVMGRRVGNLVDGILGAGYHEARFDGEGLPSGSYLYRLESPGQILVRTMVLLK